MATTSRIDRDLVRVPAAGSTKRMFGAFGVGKCDLQWLRHFNANARGRSRRIRVAEHRGRGGGRRIAPRIDRVGAAYYDTADLDLVANGITLRRNDDGDSVPMAVGDAHRCAEHRTDVEVVGPPPAELTRLLMAVTSGKELGDVVSVRTARQLYRISRRDDEDSYAVLVDDRVFASTADRLAVWREVEVGVGPGIGTIPERLARRLEERRAPAPRVGAPTRARAARTPPNTRTTRAAGHGRISERPDRCRRLRGYRTAQRLRPDPRHQGGDPPHTQHVLRVFAKLFKRTAAAELESELKWFAALLGEVRDFQVRRDRFAKALNGLPDELILGPVRSSMRNTLLGHERPARRRVSDAMDSERYLALMAALLRWRTAPPMSTAFGEHELRRRCRKAQRKADRRLLAAVRCDDETALHSARKAAKRARYAGELLGAVQQKARRKAKGYKKIQSVLGDHQDTVVARDMLRRMAAGTGPAQVQNGFTYGLLHAHEQRTAG